ncbi:MAG: helix-turn-helix domain-containing protein [Sphingomonas sp.]|uniref:hypothetical protein n=1 Tax=Sphingomonas sp. TaxID=28214 RepID=UPI0025E942BE|nr:hypothetical protein [Sphingomonas sp.]MBY0282490.1 helix-turn-helix domain-containing protein [Sphingomonas sp.]
MNRAYLGRVERGRQNIWVTTAVRIATALGTELAALFVDAAATHCDEEPAE